MTTVTAEGVTLQEAFAALAAALFDLVVDLGAVEERELREVRAHGQTLPALLERWVDECLYVHEVEGFAARRAEFVVWSAADGEPGGEPMRLHAWLRGEAMQPRHRREDAPTTIARAAGRPARVEAAGDGYRVSVEVA